MVALGRITPVKVPAHEAKPGGDRTAAPPPGALAASGAAPAPGPGPQPAEAAPVPPPAVAGDGGGLDGPTLTALHREYLASRIEASVAPPARVVAILPSVFLALLIAVGAFAWFGHVDIVVSTTGRIVPAGKVELVQPSMPGTIAEILVAEGDAVAAGQPLVVLDPTEAEAERALLARQVSAGALEIARLEALLGLTVLARGDTAIVAADYFAPPDGADPVLARAARQHGEVDVADAQTAKLIAGRRAVVAEREKLAQVIPILADREAALAHLLNQQLTARSEYLAVKRELVETTQQAVVLDRRLAEADRDIAKARADREAMLAGRESEVAGMLADQAETVAASRQELVKAEDRSRRQTITAPDAGIVTQVSVATVGGVVQTGEALMRLVPTTGALEASVTVPNQEIGFVEAGQDAVVKIDAFNYLRYGTLPGRVVKLSADAVDPTAAARAAAEGGAAASAAGTGPGGQQATPSYTATIALEQETVTVDGRAVRPTPGMTVTVDIKTGERRVAEFLLQPVLRYAEEGFRER
jgi:hemolysin D